MALMLGVTPLGTNAPVVRTCPTPGPEDEDESDDEEGDG